MLFSFAPISFSASISHDKLLGKWEFTYWMEEGDEGNKQPINMIMEFRNNGEVISSKSGSSAKANFEVVDENIIYADQRGQQTWEVMFFEPGKILKVNHKGAIMFFEKK